MSTQNDFSIVIPIFQEVENIPELVARIASISFATHRFEVILVDDNSQDGSEELIKALAQQYHWLKMIVRKEPRSLSQSALLGFQQAKYPIVILMDADLSHPPEKIPAMLNALTNPYVDFVVGSRYITSGSIDAKWPLRRRISSRMVAMLTSTLLKVKVKDPLSGFFAFRKQNLFGIKKLNLQSWKIGLELMVKTKPQHIIEIPIHFSERLQGKSKLNSKVVMHYVRQFFNLCFYKIGKLA